MSLPEIDNVEAFLIALIAGAIASVLVYIASNAVLNRVDTAIRTGK